MSDLLIKDISEISKQNTNFIHKPYINIFPIFHTEKKDLFGNDGIVIQEIIEYRDYSENFSDYIEAKFSIFQGTFYYDILPYLDNLEITIKKEKFYVEKNKPTIEVEKYKAYFLYDKNPILNQNISMSRADLNNLLPLSITLQLLDRSAETIRIKTVQGNFDKLTVKNKSLKIQDVIKSIYAEQCNKILIDNKPSIEAIEIEEPHNKDEIDSLLLPSNSRLINLADYVQNDVIGIYHSGVGSYVQKYKDKKTLFIYSLYDGKKFEKAENKIMIYIPSDMKFSVNEKTYSFSNNILKIVTNPNTSIADLMDTKAVSEGTGVRISNASSYMKKPVLVTEQGPKFKKSQLSTEIVLSERKDGLNFASKPERNITSNLFSQLSEIKKRRASAIKLTWSNSFSNMIYPGASCKLIFEAKNKIQEVFGVIHKVVTKYSNESSTLLVGLSRAHSTFSSSTSLEIIIPKEDK